MTFKQDTEFTPVLFRADKKDGEVTAVFPTLVASTHDESMMCYAHVGQHSGCSRQWVRRNTRPATFEEYRDLKAELEGAPYGYRLMVRKIISKKLRYAFYDALRAVRKGA